MRLVALASGSRGNAALIELGGAVVLVDAGLSARELGRRVAAAGVEPRRIDAVLLSHEHEDHSRGAAHFSRAHGVPVFSSHQTLEAMDASPSHFADWHALAAWGCDLGRLRVETFAVPHDAAAPVGFVLHGEGLRVAIVTDLGHVTTLVRERLHGCHVQMVESNHDDRLLRDGPYPWPLKQRVAGRFGHLSNREAAALLDETVDGECRAVVLAHLSEQNNRPALARDEVARALKEGGGRLVTIRVAAAAGPTPAVVL